VSATGPPALRVSIWLDDGGRAVHPIAIEGEELTVGRGADCDIRLPHAAVGSIQASIRRASDGEGWEWVESGGPEPTIGRGGALAPGEALPLVDGHELRVGPFRLALRARSAGSASGMAPPRSSAEASRRLAATLLGLGTGPPEGDEALCPVIANGPSRGQWLTIPTTGDECTVGRSRRCDHTLADRRLSRRHAGFGRSGDALYVRDLGSRNGVRVNGDPVEGRQALNRDDVVEMGTTRLCVSDGVEALLDHTATLPPKEASRRRTEAERHQGRRQGLEKAWLAMALAGAALSSAVLLTLLLG